MLKKVKVTELYWFLPVGSRGFQSSSANYSWILSLELGTGHAWQTSRPRDGSSGHFPGMGPQELSPGAELQMAGHTTVLSCCSVVPLPPPLAEPQGRA